MRLRTGILVSLIAISVQAKEIAITFDDAPRPDTELFTGEERTQKLIENLQKARVDDVLFFVTTKHITEKSRKRVEDYVLAGFHLGNHSHNHYSAHWQDLESYLADISKAKGELQGFENVLPFYRYPYLHEGKDRMARDRIRQQLQDLGYKNGYVTIDNFDWHMDRLLQKALADDKHIDYEALKHAYIAILWEAIVFYDDIAQKTLGRSPKHVLLLHENDIAALFIEDLISHIRSQGWKIISPQEAFEDPIASIIPDVLYNGQGRVAAIAKSKGWDEKLLRNGSSSEEYIDQYFEENDVFKVDEE